MEPGACAYADLLPIAGLGMPQIHMVISVSPGESYLKTNIIFVEKSHS